MHLEDLPISALMALSQTRVIYQKNESNKTTARIEIKPWSLMLFSPFFVHSAANSSEYQRSNFGIFTEFRTVRYNNYLLKLGYVNDESETAPFRALRSDATKMATGTNVRAWNSVSGTKPGVLGDEVDGASPRKRRKRASIS
jgi:hypothetical protein